MPRELRQFEVGGIYHIIQRGVEKRKIFTNSQDYSRFILGLEFFSRDASVDIWNLVAPGVPGTPGERIVRAREESAKPIVELMAFALMPNHFHLIVREIQEGGISLFMMKMGGYSRYFNNQHNRIGPLFQSRYKMVPVKTDAQLSILFAYVHTNPVELVEPKWKDLKVVNRKKATDFLGDYKWSSYRDYLGLQNFSNATQCDFFLDLYGGTRGCRQMIEDWIYFKADNAGLDLKIME